MVFRGAFFWVQTAVFVLLGTALLWKVLPPIISQYQENSLSIQRLEQQIADRETFTSTLNDLKAKQQELEAIFEQAQVALPITPESINLMLQFDGLISSLNLPETTATVPLQPAIAEGEAVESAPTVGFSLTGAIDFPTMRNLLVQLKSFGRWHKITSVELNQSGDRFNSTITAEALFKSAVPVKFSGDPRLLEKAATVFAKYQSYATTPDITREGSFGRSNPFAP